MTKTIVLGDIHGCLEEFDEALKVSEYRQGDRLVLAGDLVDRGPDPLGVLRRAQELGAEAVQGNHEEKHLRYRRHELKKQSDPKYRNPMKEFSEQRLKEHRSFQERDWAWLASLPLWIQLRGTWIVLHAGLEPNISLTVVDEKKTNMMLRLRFIHPETKRMLSRKELKTSPKAFWAEHWTGPQSILFGHHVFKEGPTTFLPQEEVQCIGLDTGCCFGRSLTAAILADGKLVNTVSVRAKREYYPFIENYYEEAVPHGDDVHQAGA